MPNNTIDIRNAQNWLELPEKKKRRLEKEAQRKHKRHKFNLGLAGMALGPFAAAGLLQATGRSYNGKYMPYNPQIPPNYLPAFGMSPYEFQKSANPKGVLTKPELESRKKKQIRYTEAGVVTGLGSGGLFATGHLAGRAGSKRIARATEKVPVKMGPTLKALSNNSGKLKSAGIVAGSIGGVATGLAGINNAKIQRSEFNREFGRKPIKKIDQPYNPEINRYKRSKNRSIALIGGGVTSAAAAKPIANAADKQRFHSKVIKPIKQENAEIKDLNIAHEKNLNQWKIKRLKLNNAMVEAGQKVVGNKLSPEYAKAKKAHDDAFKAYMEHAKYGPPSHVPVKEKELPKFKPGKISSRGTKIGLASGAALAGLGVANEIHRRSKGSMPYQ